MLCENFGNQLAEGSVFCPKCGANVGECAPATVSTSTESYFDGGVFQRLGWKLLGALVTGVTLGICYPFAVRWLYEWEAKHTVINGRRLKFVGTAGGLFGTWLLCLLLIVVTLGIYSIWVPLKIRKWREANTFFEDEIPTFDTVQNLKNEKASYFDGGLWQLIGWGLLGIIITIFTAGICYPWAIQMVYSWEQRHKVYNHKRCTFDGTAMQLFGTWLLCILLSIVTFGIYTWWVPLKIKKWQIKHTHLLEDETPVEEQEEKTLTPEEIEARRLAKEKQKKQLKKIGIVAGCVLVVLCVLFHNYIGYGLSGEYKYKSISEYKYDKKSSAENAKRRAKLNAKIKKNQKLKVAKISKGTKKIEDKAFIGASSLKEVNIPYGVTEIGYDAFKDCTSLTSITIPNSVTEIGYGAFEDCTSLTSVTIPDSVTTIGGFKGCTSLTSITIPDSVTVIGNGAFEGCTSLTVITIPKSVTRIGKNAFYKCDSLKTVNYRGTREQWNWGGSIYTEDHHTSDYNIRNLATINYNYTGK